MKWKWLIALLLAACGLLFIFLGRQKPLANALRTRELASRGLAEFLAQRFAGHCAVIVSNPFTRQKGLARAIYGQEEAGLKGLREGFGGRIQDVVAFPELKSEAQQNPFGLSTTESSTPLTYLVAEKSFDKIASESQCDVIVSLIGLPADVEKLATWQPADKHLFALLLPDLRVLGDLAAVRKAVQSGKIGAFVLNKPGAPPEQGPFVGDWKSEFNRRFLLVNADNFEEMVRQYPQAFGMAG